MFFALSLPYLIRCVVQLLRFLVAESEAAQLNDKSGWRLSRVVRLESTLAVVVLRLLVHLLTHRHFADAYSLQWLPPQIRKGFPCHDVIMWQTMNSVTPRYDDVIKWKHFPRNWPFGREIHRSPVNFPHKGQWRGALMFSLICARKNGWVNNREAGDLRRYRVHYGVIVMKTINHCQYI